MKRFISLFLSILLIFPVIPLGMVSNVKAATVTTLAVDKTAAANGTTVFNTIQDAINVVPSNNTSATPYEIQIKNGTYVENLTLSKSGVTLTGESQDGVLVTGALPDLVYLNDGGYTKFQRGGTAYNAANEYTPAVLTLKGSDCTLQNMTLKLSEYYTDMGPISAIAIDSGAQRNSFKYCTLGGGQDTLYDNGRTYYYRCTISGSVDFIYGSGSSVFDSCDIKSIYWERLYNISEVNGIIPYGLSESDRTSRGITAEDIALWTATDPLRSKYPNIINGPNLRTPGSSTKPVDYGTPDFTRLLTADELNALTDAELSSRQIARDSSGNPNNWKTIAELTASDSKRIKKVNSGHLTACSTPQNALGYLFINCNLIGDPRLSVESCDLGRPWRPYSQTTYVNCKMGPHILAAGWNNWGNPANETTARYEEYGSMNLDGTPYDVSKRFAWAKILTDVEVLSRNPYNYLKGTDGWDPTNQAIYYTELNNIANSLPINGIQSVTTNLDLPTTDAASGAAIQWLSSNTNIISTTGVVNRPAFNAQNEAVTLTAAVTKGGRGVLKEFNLTVLKAPDSNSTDPDYIACLDAYTALQTSVIPGLNLLEIKNDLTLPTAGINGTSLEWKSFNSSITDDGKVTRPAGTASDSIGTLQLTIRKNQAAVAFSFDTKVIKYMLPVAGMYTSADFVGANIGNPTVSGSTSYDHATNQFTVSGGGSGPTKNNTDPDKFYFSGVKMSGDFTISAKITNLRTGKYPTAGLTIRDSLEATSYHVTDAWQLANKERKMTRYSGSNLGSNATIDSLSNTAYIQLTRKGSAITTVFSSAPIAANPTASADVKINVYSNTNIGKDAKGNDRELYTGFIINPGDDISTSTATFSDVKIVTAEGAVVFDSNSQSLAVPTNVAATSGDKSVLIAWDTVSNATCYKVKQSTDAAGPFTVVGSVYYNTVAGSVYGSVTDLSVNSGRMQVKVGSLVNGQTYYFAVTAGNSYGESSPSEAVSVIPAVTYEKIKSADFVGADIGAPTVAGSTSFDDDTNTFTLTGAGTNISKSAGGPDQTYFSGVNLKGDYTINAKVTALNFSSNTKGYVGLTFRDGLNTNSYHFTQMVQYGNSSSRKMFRYTGSANGSSTNTSITGTAYIRLKKVGNNITSVISTSPIPKDPVASTTTTINTATATGLGLDANGNPKELYAGFILSSGYANSAVAATFEDVTIEMSDGTVVFDSNEGKPIAPKNVAAKPNDQSVAITWDGLSTATSYTVKQSTDAAGPFIAVQTVMGSVYQASINGLENDKKYYFVVTASNSSGESVPSKMVSATPSASATIPPVITVTSGEPAGEVFSALLPLKGKVNKASTLTIALNGKLVKLDGDKTSLSLRKNGEFSSTLVLAQGDNTIVIKALDEYDLETTITYKVTYTYKTEKIGFYDANGTVLTGLNPGEDIIVKADVENYIAAAKDSVLIVGLYDAGNSLVKFVYTAETISNGESETFYVKFKLPEDVSGYTVKAYVWDNFIDMHPISDVMVLK